MLRVDVDSFVDSLSLTPRTLPARSRLYSLEPMGRGTALVESQTGYMARLAEAHGVTVAILFGWEIAPHVDRAYVQRKLAAPNKSMVLASGFRPLARAMNGTGRTAHDWIRALEAGTMRSDLTQMTLLAWRHVLSHQHLIREMRAWCPACYEQRRMNREVIYEPLLWSLEAICACSIHKRRLRTKCQHCNRQLHHLASHSRPGFCSACRLWLGVSPDEGFGESERVDDDEYEWQKWASASVGEMLAAASNLTAEPSKGVIAGSAKACVVRGTPQGTILAFSRSSGISKQTITNWCRGERALRLESLLRMCFAAGASPLDFLTGRLERPQKEKKESAPVEQVNDAIRPRRHRKLILEEVEKELKSALEEIPPPSMIGVGRRMERPTSALTYQFPKLCKAIVKRFEAYQRRLRRKSWPKARRALEAALRDETHPCIAEVARKIEWTFTRLCRNFPDLCREISISHTNYLRSGWSETGHLLEAALQADPPPSVQDTSGRLNVCESSLYSHFPLLCRRIAARHLEFRRRAFAERKKEFLDDVRRAALALHEEGIYPSVKKVEKLLTAPKSLRSNKAALALLRNLRLELNLEPQTVNPTSF